MRSTTAISTLDAANAAIILVFGLFLFSIQDVIIKHFSGHYSVLQIVFTRGIIAICLMLLFFRLAREAVPLVSRRPGMMLARGLLGFASYTTFYLAVAAMPLAEVVSITFTMPLIVTAMSALLLGEKVGRRRWSAVVVGFIGVVIILSPSGEFNTLAVILAFSAAMTYAAQTILTRYLGAHDHPMTIAFNAIVIFTLAVRRPARSLLGTSVAGLLRPRLAAACRYRHCADDRDRLHRGDRFLLPVTGLLLIRGKCNRALRVHLYPLGSGFRLSVLAGSPGADDADRSQHSGLEQSLHLVPRTTDRARRNRAGTGAGRASATAAARIRELAHY